MADTATSQETELTDGNLADGDLARVTDVSDTTQSANGSSKKITLLSLANYVLGKIAVWVAALTSLASPASSDGLYVDDSGVAKRSTIDQVVTAGHTAAYFDAIRTAVQASSNNGTVLWDASATISKSGVTHSTTTNPDRITIDTAGKYTVEFNFRTKTIAAGHLIWIAHYNSSGTAYSSYQSYNVSNGQNQDCMVRTLSCVAGDYIVCHFATSLTAVVPWGAAAPDFSCNVTIYRKPHIDGAA